jgi:hypothetical protein
MPRSPPLLLKAKSNTADGMIEIHLPHCFRGSFTVLGTKSRIHFSPPVSAETTLSHITDGTTLYFIGELFEEDVLVQKDEIELDVRGAPIIVQFSDDLLGQLSQLDSNSVEIPTPASEVYSELTSSAQLPKPTNHASLTRRNDSIKGTYIINPSLRFHHIFQEYIDQASVAFTNNFQAIVDDGAIDVDIWLADDSLLSNNANPRLERAKALISLEIQNSRDSVLARIVSLPQN